MNHQRQQKILHKHRIDFFARWIFTKMQHPINNLHSNQLSLHILPAGTNFSWQPEQDHGR